VDFIVQVAPKTFLPLEVKYKNSIDENDLTGVRKFSKQFQCYVPIIVTKKWDWCGMSDSIAYLPLPQFLLMVD
jgi:predicted AAA+ superfamily ATPase